LVRRSASGEIDESINKEVITYASKTVQFSLPVEWESSVVVVIVSGDAGTDVSDDGTM